jgi:hypothetical protein
VEAARLNGSGFAVLSSQNWEEGGLLCSQSSTRVKHVILEEGITRVTNYQRANGNDHFCIGPVGLTAVRNDSCDWLYWVFGQSHGRPGRARPGRLSLRRLFLALISKESG